MATHKAARLSVPRCGRGNGCAVIGLMRNMLHREAPNIAREVDRVIVDGPSHISALTRSALLTADLVLVPVQLPPFVRAGLRRDAAARQRGEHLSAAAP